MLITYLNNAATIAMGDEFDGFVDENYERELIPESMVLFCGFQMAHYIFDLLHIYETFMEQPNQIHSATHHARNL